MPRKTKKEGGPSGGGGGGDGSDAHAKKMAAVDALLADLKKLKPSSSKGIYFKKITLSSTMGPGLTIDHSALV